MLIFFQAEEPDVLDLLIYKSLNSLRLLLLKFSTAKLVPLTSTETSKVEFLLLCC